MPIQRMLRLATSQLASILYLSTSALAAPVAYVPSGTQIAVIDTQTNAVISRIDVGGMAISVAVHPSEPLVYTTVARADIQGEVAVIDTRVNAVVAVIPLPSSPMGVALSYDGSQAYVATTDGALSVIDTPTLSVRTRIQLPSAPATAIALDLLGTFAYVTHGGERGAVSVVDVSTMSVVATIGVGPSPSGVAADRAGHFVYVANNADNTVSVLDASANQLVGTISVGAGPYAVVVSVDGSRVYVSNSSVALANGDPVAPTVSVIDSSLGTVVATIDLADASSPHVTSAGAPSGISLTPDDRYLYVIGSPLDSVSVIDTTTNTTTVRISVPGAARGLGLFIGTPLSHDRSGDGSTTLRRLVLQAPNVQVILNQPSFQTGQTLTIGLQAQNPSGNPSADLYVGVIFPDGQTAVFFRQGGSISAGVSLSRPALFTRLQGAPPGFSMNAAPLFQFTFPATGIPAGTYQVFAAMTQLGALLSGRIDPGAILALDLQSFTFTPGTATLTVTLQGAGSGRVTSLPSAVSCSTEQPTSGCNLALSVGTAVTLTATPVTDSDVFAGWGGDCTGAGTFPTCAVAMTASRAVTATFNPRPPTTATLTVAVAGGGSGRVVSSPAGIDCTGASGAGCSMTVAIGASVILTASPSAANNVLHHWEGGTCNGFTTSSCTLTVSQNTTVTGVIVYSPPPTATLTVSVPATGNGVVTSTPAGITCGGAAASCALTVPVGTAVVLHATPATANDPFHHWEGGGACNGTTATTCTVTVTQNAAVMAVFLYTPPVTYPNLIGSYRGTVTFSETRCYYADDNGIFSASITVVIGNQTSGSFSGTMTATSPTDPGRTGAAVFQGTVTPQGSASGAFTFDGYSNGIFNARTTGSFTGTANGAILILNVSGQITTGETCLVNGTVSVSR